MLGGTFNNNGSFTANTASLLLSYGTGGTNAFNNAGTFIKLGTGTTQFTVSSSGVPFNNTGSVDVQAGTLTLDAGGTSSNAMNVAASGTLSFGSSYTHTPGGSVSGAGTLTFTNGTHSFAAGQFNPTGTVNFSGGTITVNDTFNAAALGTITAFVTLNAPESFGNLTLAGGGTLSGSGNVTVNGTLNWTGGTMSGTGQTLVAAGGALNLSGSTHQLNRVLQNDGTATWTASALQMLGGTFNNNGSFTANTASLLLSYGTGGTNAFNNAGTFIKLGAGTTQFTVSSSGVPFNNTGSVDVQAGTLTLDAGGTSGNTMNVAASGTLSFASSYTHQAASTLTSSGAVSLNSGIHTFAGLVTSTGTLNISATANFNVPTTLGGGVTLSGGTLSGTGNVTVNGTLNWTGGTMSGTGQTLVPAGGTLNLSGSTHQLNRVLQNDGTAAWTAGALQMQGGTLDNNGSFTANTASLLQSYGTGGTNAFNNAGTFIKLGAGTTQFTTSSSGVPFNNTGSVDVQAGTLSLSAGLTNLSGTTLSGGSYLVSGTLRISGADIRTNSATIILTGVGAAIVNDATSANALANFGTITTLGNLTIQGGRNLTVPGPFSNSGHVTIGQTSTFTVSLGNYTQSAGTTTVDGILDPANNVDIQAGTLGGSGHILGNVNNAGSLNPGTSPGILNVEGNYNQTTTGILNVEIGGIQAGNQFDRLAVSGIATLDGTLAISLINGYQVNSAETFQVLTFGSRSGDFAVTTGLDVGSGIFLRSTYSSTDLTLTANDVGIVVTPTSGLTTTEAGGSAQFSVVLSSQPNADVTIGISSGNPAEGLPSAASLTFLPSNWNVPQTVIVTGVDDLIDDGDVSYTIVTANAVSDDPAFAGVNPSNVAIVNLDDDTAGFDVSPTILLSTTEGGGLAEFTIQLTSQPTANVVVALTSSDSTEGSASPSSLTFTPASWNIAQFATVIGVNDFVDDGDVGYSIITTASSSDSLYHGLAVPDALFVNVDDDTAGISVSLTSGLITTESGGAAQFTITLDAQPTANVSIALSSSDTTEGIVSPSSVTFTTANWNTPRVVTITGVDDFLVDGDIAYSIVTAPATSTDPLYNNFDAPDVAVVNNDNNDLHPDLQVTGLVVNPSSVLQSGGRVTIDWNDANTGNGATSGSWSDRIVVVNTTTGQTLVNTTVAFSGGVLVIGGTAARQFSFDLPRGDVGVGDLLVTITTDANNTVVESNLVGTGESNNAASLSTTSTLTPYADLETSGVVLIGPSGLALAGDLITVTWNVNNVGLASTNDGTPGNTVADWTDRLVLSTDTTFGNSDDVQLSDVAHSGALAAAQGYGGSWTGHIPTGTSGAFFVLVKADHGTGFGAVFENNDVASNVARTAATFDVAATPYSDLLAAITVSPSVGQIGRTIDLAWQVTNNAATAAATTGAGPWYDRVVLSRDNIIGNVDDVNLGDFAHTGAVALGASYTAAKTVTLPSNFVGDGYLFVVADVLGNVYEYTFEGNNASTAQPLTVQAADLTVTDVRPNAANATFGETLSLDFTVLNVGTGPTTGAVRDRIWLSLDRNLGGDTLLATLDALTLPVVVGGQYQQLSTLVNLPLLASLAEGAYYLIVQTDALGNQPESNESNNFTASVTPFNITFPLLPDLRVDNITVDETTGNGLLSGGPMTIRWQTHNDGAAPVSSLFHERIVVTNAGQTLLNTIVTYDATGNGSLAGGAAAARLFAFTLPDGVSGAGTLNITVTTDSNNEVVESFGGATPETNNSTTTSVTSNLPPYPDLLVNGLLISPTTVQTGQAINVSWQTINAGTETVGSAFSERVRVVKTTNGQVLVDQTVVYNPAADGNIGAGQGRSRSLAVTIPDGSASAGNLSVTVTTDQANAVFEFNPSGTGESNNAANAPLTVILAPYPDLLTSGVTAPGQIIADPAHATIGWTVTNAGSREAAPGNWFDVIYASRDTTLGNSDDIELARFERTTSLAVAGQYSRSEQIVLPPAFTGRFHVFVKADGSGGVFEDGVEGNNSARAVDFLDVMPIPYADLIVQSVNVPGPAFSGQNLQVNWRIENRGIGLTDRSNWSDAIWLASDAAGNNRTNFLGSFTHFGQLAVGDGYDRTANVRLPEGLTGQYYIVVVTGGVFEFIHTDNNTAVSSEFSVELTPPPDLTVTNIVAPALAVEEATPIDIEWTVANVGGGAAGGYWEDTVYLRKAGDPNAPTVFLGAYRYDGPLGAGLSYTRREQVLLPGHIYGLYETVVTTNYNGRLYEYGATTNNTRVDDAPIPITLMPRPDLRVSSIVAPAEADPNQSIALEFTVINSGNAATDVPNWSDRVFLSLDPTISSDDIPVGTFGNQSALDPAESYRTTSGSVVVPPRFRGTVYLIVQTDSGSQVDEFPNDANNVKFAELFVRPQPLPDLVVDSVVVPTQIIEGSTAEVRFTVTNLGPGETAVDSWSDTIWLTRDKNRPHPGQGDVLLKTIPHQGALVNRAGYDVITTVQIPAHLVSGTYYLMPWTDPYDVVFEDTLAANVNPDDPTEIDNNNYKAGRSDALGTTVVPAPKPDLIVTSVVPVTETLGGAPFHVSWTVKNDGKGVAVGAWSDEIWLADGPNVDPNVSNSLRLGEVRHEGGLSSKSSYTGSLDVTLSPSAHGQYIVVKTDFQGGVAEDLETNNSGGAATIVTPAPADLVVTSVEVLPDNRSGELTMIRYTVQNQGANPVWPGTGYWTDHVWISADGSFVPTRASWFGKAVHSNATPLQPGESYTTEVTATLPRGIVGDLFVYIHVDTHDRDERTVQTAWWPAEDGRNEILLQDFSRWADEDPGNNVFRAPIHVTYYEPDLVIGNLQIPLSASSGQAVNVGYTVTNVGTRDTRESTWYDRVFLSKDPSLDRNDTLLGEFKRTELLRINESYTSTVPVVLPDGISGTFYVLVLTDSPAIQDRSVQSDIGFGNFGVGFQAGFPLSSFDRLQEAARLLARADVAEYQQEGNNTAKAPLPVVLTSPPDLRVTQIDVPLRVRSGQEFDVTYTVSNVGGVAPPSQLAWDDLIYFSRDRFLDLRADRFLDSVRHTGGLGAGQSYTVTRRVQAPAGLSDTEEFYVFVATDPPRNTSFGSVFELDKETNNDRVSDLPVVVELPPPSDLVVTSITLPATAMVNDPISVTWTITNQSTEPAVGIWSDTAYLSTDATWDLGDVPLGRLSFAGGTLAAGASYTQTLNTLLPPSTPGQYRVIVRTDIFNQVYEREFEGNNRAASSNTLTVSVPARAAWRPSRHDALDRAEPAVPGVACRRTRRCASA